MLQLPGSCMPSVGAATKQTQPHAVTTSAASRKLMGDAKIHTRDSDGGHLLTSMKPPRFSTAEKLASST